MTRRRQRFYILKGKTVVPAVGLEAWAQTGGIKQLEATGVGDSAVSTIFLGIDHRIFGDGPPLIFETAVIGYDANERHGTEVVGRCSTWEEAMMMHRATCKELREAARQKRKA